MPHTDPEPGAPREAEGAAYPGRGDRTWEPAADARIEQHRKGDFTLRLRDVNGKPLAGREIQVRLTRHAFPFGTALKLALMRAADNDDARVYRETFFENFSAAVTENDLKWPPYLGGQDRYALPESVAVLKDLHNRGIYLRGHVLLWPSWQWTPSYLRAFADDPEQLHREIDFHIARMGRLLDGVTDAFDVINEPFSHHDLIDLLGDELLARCFRTADGAFPRTKLFINDFAILTGDDAAHREHYRKTIDFLLREKAPLDGIGLQGHFPAAVTPLDEVWRRLEEFAAFGLPLHVTEFDINTDDEDLQAAYTYDFMKLCFSHPAVEAFLMWGFWEKAHWIPKAAMVRADWTLKPNGEAYRRLVLDEWCTRIAGVTDEAGTLPFRGFFGDYAVEVRNGGATQNAATRFDRHVREQSLQAPSRPFSLGDSSAGYETRQEEGRVDSQTINATIDAQREPRWKP